MTGLVTAQAMEDEIPPMQIQDELAPDEETSISHPEKPLWQLKMNDNSSFVSHPTYEEVLPRHQTLHPKFTNQMPPSVQKDINAAISSFNLRQQHLPMSGLNLQVSPSTISQLRVDNGVSFTEIW